MQRRAKFRQDLTSEIKKSEKHHHKHLHGWHHLGEEQQSLEENEKRRGQESGVQRYNLRARRQRLPESFHDQSEAVAIDPLSPGLLSGQRTKQDDGTSSVTSISQALSMPVPHDEDLDSDGEIDQDIKEVWFAGCHAVSVLFRLSHSERTDPQ